MSEESTDEISRPLERQKHEQKYCAACHKPETDDAKMKRCSRCKLIHYCSANCQKNDFRNHKEVCKALRQSSLAPLDASLSIDSRGITTGELILCAADECNPESIEEVAYLYEQALDKFLEYFVDLREKEEETPTDRNDFAILRLWIPFLLAVLGHDSFAMAELANSLHKPSMGADRQPRKVSVYDNMSQLGVQESGEMEFVGDWPPSFLIAYLLIKSRLALDLRSSRELCAEFRSTNAAQVLESVMPVIETFVSGWLALLVEQEVQISAVISVLRGYGVIDMILVPGSDPSFEHVLFDNFRRPEANNMSLFSILRLWILNMSNEMRGLIREFHILASGGDAPSSWMDENTEPR